MKQQHIPGLNAYVLPHIRFPLARTAIPRNHGTDFTGGSGGEMIVCNGIDARTGRPLIEISEEELTDLIAKSAIGTGPEQVGVGAAAALPWDVIPTEVAQAGWSVVFAHSEQAEVRAALEPLVAHRASQVDAVNLHQHEYFPGEDLIGWLARHAVNPGTIDPSRVGYYVLLVGSPAQIPFEFQYLLDIEYAVGRVAFDTPEEYQRYAESVVAAEAGDPARDRVAAYWGTRHAWDRATKLSADQLLQPLLPGDESEGLAERFGYRSIGVVGDGATRQALLDLLAGHDAGAGRPGLLVTASHGLGGLPADSPDQRSQHGALVCQDWTGGPVGPSVTLAGTDVADAKVHGLIAFLFACYGAGTPQLDDFPRYGSVAPQIATEPFVACLPQRLLAHPDGGALAVIGHVERAWGYSITSAGGSQLGRFKDVFGQLVSGVPVGHSMRTFNEAYAILSTTLARSLRSVDGDANERRRLLTLWMERTDVQNYVVLGDPAVSLRS
ncbi:hypothetical protein AB0H36_41695 [Kribbella sp. NPDC050820]|uniref:hypothetical protein n=1 Tax=Kribbella sp. NPDC050820 TaxID=3155408 RepID=UPI0033FD9CD7